MESENFISDAIVNTLCAPCMTESLSIVASKFCKECQEYLCPNCVKHHQKLGITKQHCLTEFETELPNNSAYVTAEERCIKHNGKIIAMFCSPHEEIGCHECMSERHKHCGEIDYIPKRANAIAESVELRLIKEELENTSDKLKSLRNERQNDLQRIDRQKDEILNVFDDMKQKIVKKLQDIEVTSKEQCVQRYSENKGNIEVDISACSDLAYTLDTMSDAIQSTANETMLFLQMMRAKRNILAATKLVSYVSQRKGKQQLIFNPDPRFEHSFDGTEVFGQVRSIQRIFNATFVGKYNVSVPSDQETVGVTMFGCTYLPDGGLVVTDFTNKRLKILNTEYKVTSLVELCGSPCGVCVTGDKELAICIFDRRLVQFVSFRSPIRPTRSFKTELKCQGIACDGDHLFVTVTGESTNQVRIYTIEGSLQRIIEESDGIPLFFRINQIAYCQLSSQFYVTDTKKGVICLNKKGNVLSCIEEESLIQPTGVSPDGEGGLFVAGFKSNGLLHFGQDKRKVKVFLRDEVNVKEPLCLCFDCKSAQLTITLAGSKFIHVFKLDDVCIN